MISIKKCYRCLLDKLATKEFFHINSQSKDGLNYYCKECVRNKAKVRYHNLKNDSGTIKNNLASLTKRCSSCQHEYPQTTKYFNYLHQNKGYSSDCKACHSEKVRNRIGTLKDEVDAIKLNKGCADCGYNKHPAALDFDHLPQFIKLCSVGTLVTRGKREETFAEIAKCEVVCANCHRIRTTLRHTEKRRELFNRS